MRISVIPSPLMRLNMLLRFSLENHLSINSEQELSMIAASLKGDGGMLIKTPAVPQEKLLTSAIIYGPNASGKSNIIDGLSLMRAAVLYSQSRWEIDTGVHSSPFMLEDGKSECPSRFEVDFVSDNVRYTYGFITNKEKFVEEWLYSYPEGRARTLFTRTNTDEYKFGSGLTGQKNAVKDLVRDNSLFLSAAIQNNFKSLSPVFDFFKSLIFRNSISSPPQAIYSEFKDKEFDSRVMKFLGSVGTGIDGYKQIENERPEEFMNDSRELFEFLYRKEEKPDEIVKNLIEGLNKEYKVEFSHKSSSGKSVFLDVSNESAGTRRLIPLLVSVFNALDKGLILIVDEFDASLHTHICDLIVALFNNRDINKNNAQLIATTHDTNLLCSSNLRRDQIWLVEKDECGASELYSLAEIKTRDTDNFEKGYLQGRYGAIPFSASIDNIIEKLQ